MVYGEIKMKELAIIGIIFIFLVVGLSGCIETDQIENDKGSGTESGNDDFENDTEDGDSMPPIEDIETITISGVDGVENINYLEKPVKLLVSGIRNDITVTKETNLVNIIFSGVDNIVRVSRSHSFESVISGIGNEIVYYD
jgi:hypothetical protein